MLCTGETADSGRELRLHPLSIRETQFGNWAPFELGRLWARTQFISFSAGKDNEGRACISESLVKRCMSSMRLDILFYPPQNFGHDSKQPSMF
jgi:hypothetical protein